MKTIPIIHVDNDAGTANTPDYQGPWPPPDAVLVTSDENNYYVYKQGDTLPEDPQ